MSKLVYSRMFLLAIVRDMRTGTLIRVEVLWEMESIKFGLRYGGAGLIRWHMSVLFTLEACHSSVPSSPRWGYR